MANQNEYLRRQLGDYLRQKRRELRSSSSSRPPGSVREEEAEEEGEKEPHSDGSTSEGDSPRHPRREEDKQTIPMISRLISRSSKVS